MTKNNSFEVVAIAHRNYQKIDKSFEADACGKCASCGRLVIGSFAEIMSKGGFDLNLKPEGNLNGSFSFQRHTGSAKFVEQFPAPTGPDVPEHLPENVLKPFLEAEKSFHSGHWNAAAALYRKAVDRAITPLIGEVKGRPMLGQKLGMLKRDKALPQAMIDWISVVKNDGNFALHDDDQDFETLEEVAPAREFARTLLTYLHTLKHKAELALSKPED